MSGPLPNIRTSNEYLMTIMYESILLRNMYQPETQGALERCHLTLKSMIKKYCFENDKNWDEGVSLLLFAARKSV